MVTAYEELTSMVEKNQLSITHIDSAPRSAATALYRGLSHVMDGEVMEPFHVSPTEYGSSFDGAMEEILKQAKAAGAGAPGQQKPVRLLVKETARYLNRDDWERWMPLVDCFMSAVRDPHLQLDSLITRDANDMQARERGADHLTREQVKTNAHVVAEFLKRGVPGDVQAPFIRTGWGPISGHVAQVERHLESHPEKKLILVPSFILRADPENTMKKILQQMELPTDQQTLDRVLKWDENSVEAVTQDGRRKDFAWTKRVANAKGFEPPVERTPPLDEFPTALQEHMKQCALPVYLDLLRHPNHVGPTTPSELKALFARQHGGVTLLQHNPVTAYAMMSALDDYYIPEFRLGDDGYHFNLRVSQTPTERQAFLEEIRTRFPKYSESFNIIDHALGRNPDVHLSSIGGPQAVHPHNQRVTTTYSCEL